MKASTFLWGWKECAPQPDKLMTRQRAARLLRAWRRSQTQGFRNFYLKRTGPGEYFVRHVASGETSVLIIRRAA